MKDIFEKWFDLWFPFEIYSFFIVWIIFLIFIFYLFLFKNKPKVEIKEAKKTEEKNIDLLIELEKLKNSDNFLEKSLHLFSLFLEKKSWNTEISKMSFSEFKNLNFDENFVNLFSKIYFLKYKENEIDASQIGNIFQDLKDIFEKNL